MNTTDKEVEVFEWMQKQGYDRRATQEVAPIIVKYLDQFRQAAVTPALPPEVAVIIEQSPHFIHLRTNHVPEWVKKLDELNKEIVSRLRGGNAG